VAVLFNTALLILINDIYTVEEGFLYFNTFM